MAASASDKLHAILSRQLSFSKKLQSIVTFWYNMLKLTVLYVYCLRREWKIFIQPVKEIV